MQRIPNESLDLRELVVEQVPASSMMPEPTTAITPSASTAHGSDRNTLFHPLVVVVGLDGVQCSPDLVLWLSVFCGDDLVRSCLTAAHARRRCHGGGEGDGSPAARENPVVSREITDEVKMRGKARLR